MCHLCLKLQWLPFTDGQSLQMLAEVTLNVFSNCHDIRMDTDVELESQLESPVPGIALYFLADGEV